MFSNLFRAAHRRSLAADVELPAAQEPDPDLTLEADLVHGTMLSQHSASPGPATARDYVQLRHATADFTEADDDDDDDSDNASGHEQPGRHEPSVLPLFSASHLDSLPVYSIVHAIRIIVQSRTDTMLSWEQLRSPQVSQFLVKPMQMLVRSHHYSRATLYALMANCLQFAKEGQLYPGTAGTSSTRAKVCELLAIKLLKEYSTRELIDALSYDFNPLQGMPAGPQAQLRLPTTARTSTLEVAIRANAKHFLAHPLVVQQLEAIWNGAISFYSSADYLHRTSRARAVSPPFEAAGAAAAPPAPAAGPSWTRRNSFRNAPGRASTDTRTPLLSPRVQPHHGKEEQRPAALPDPVRRTVSLYNPRNASLFKLSRLRVPRYRQFLSTCSLAVLIGLFLSVLAQHSSHITTLELVFWFWSAGFMLDELVGFTEQGFSLYIMSFWNIFDLGILLLLIFYYSLRVCGVFLADAQSWNDCAYDILAANAILLLPRIFSVLDHYQYFSQLLIAFRLMAVDLAAVFVLVVIACSGFFVFFTLSRNDTDPSEVAYKIFQILMGFTPAAWEVWGTYNYLGKVLMGLFLILCHFVIVTILVTVLTNSFMAIASNANEEHQFVFAINTISMVKNDALFSYIAPTNILAWMMMPLRYCMSLPQFVALNRLVIKITHFPLLLCIFAYEKFFLAPFMYEPTDLVENSGRARERVISFADPAGRSTIFSPSVRLREESIVGYQKDRALDEVFRRAPDMASLRTHRRNERHKTQTAVRNWMEHNDGLTLSNYSTMERAERDPGTTQRFRHMSEARSAASDPADLMSISAFPGPQARESREQLRGPLYAAFKDTTTDAEGDDEFATNDEEDMTTPRQGRTETETSAAGDDEGGEDDSEYPDAFDESLMATPTASRFLNMAARSPKSPQSSKATSTLDEADLREAGPVPWRTTAAHARGLSTNTILYNPPAVDSDSEVTGNERIRQRVPGRASRLRLSPGAGPGPGTGPGTLAAKTPPALGQRAQTQPIPVANDAGKTSGTAAAVPARRAQRRLSSFGAGTEAASELMTAPLAVDEATFATLPASFTSQLVLAQVMNARATGESERDRDRMSRLVLARMKTLEESFADVVRELRQLKQQQSGEEGEGSSEKSRPGTAGRKLAKGKEVERDE